MFEVQSKSESRRTSIESLSYSISFETILVGAVEEAGKIQRLLSEIRNNNVFRGGFRRRLWRVNYKFSILTRKKKGKKRYTTKTTKLDF